MAIIFKYNNEIILATNLQKKLKKMRLSLNDIDILIEGVPENNMDRIFNILRENPETDIKYLDSIKNKKFESLKDEFNIPRKFVWFYNKKNNHIYSEGEYSEFIDYIDILNKRYSNPEDYEIRLYEDAIFRPNVKFELYG